MRLVTRRNALHRMPVEGVHELPLIRALVGQGRGFVKPLRYDAALAGGFPNALLLDAGWESVFPVGPIVLWVRAIETQCVGREQRVAFVMREL